MRGPVGWNSLIAISVFLSVFFAGCCCCIPPEPPNPDVTPTPVYTPVPIHTPSGNDSLADWTFIVYLDGDNDLEQFALADMNELEQVGSTDRVNLVVQLDRASGQDTGDGDWTGARRYLAQQDNDQNAISSPVVQDLGDVNMGDPQSLTDFATWAMQNYPARRYALVVWDHGGGWPIVAIDEDSGNDGVTLPELNQSLAAITAANGGSKLDIVGFDACLMGMYEVGVEVAPYADELVASEETIPADGWDYAAIAGSLADNPDQDAGQLSSVITSSYLTYYETVNKDQTVTLSAIDLTRIDELSGSIDRFSNALAQASRTDAGWRAISQAKENAESYGKKEWGYVDLGDFADIIASVSDDSGVQGAARNLTGTIGSVMLYSVHGDQHPHSSGMSIDSSTDAAGNNTHYMALASAGETGWTDFMAGYYGEQQTGSSPIAVGELELDRTSISPGETLAITTTINGTDISNAEMMVFRERTDSSGNAYYVLVDYIDYAPPTYELDDGSTMQYWASQNDVQVEWDGTGTTVEDDEGYLNIAITPIERNSSMYSIEGTYNRTNGRASTASLVFDMRTRELTYIWDYDNTAEIVPKRGDTFEAETPAFDLEEGSDIFYVPYEALIWGETGWTVSNRPLSAGNYMLALYAENFYGDSDLQVAEVEVRGS